jgi:hypothetical protein
MRNSPYIIIITSLTVFFQFIKQSTSKIEITPVKQHVENLNKKVRATTKKDKQKSVNN